MPELAYVNGEFMPIAEAMVPIEDRGYQFGDGVYEVVNSYKGKLFGFQEHLDRLERSLNELDFPPVSMDEIRGAILELFKRSGFERASVYLQISRGVAERDHAYHNISPVQIVMTVRPVHEKPKALRENGAEAITVEDIRWGRCDIKTIQLIPNCMAKQKALDAGVFDAIFVAEGDIVREATSANICIVQAGTVVTHPANHQILNGITRIMVIDCCKELDVPFTERQFTRQEMLDADEVFLTGTTTEVLAIVKIDGQTIGGGIPGELSKRLQIALHEKMGSNYT
jgi:D-alanine transaminase